MSTPYAPPASPYAPGPRPPGGSSGDYEFSDVENILLGDLASNMSFVGIFNVIGGILLMLLGVVAMLAAGPIALVYIVQGVVNFLVGIWTRSSAAGFRRIVDTQGNDVANLMTALGDLKRIYALQKIVIIVTMVVVVLGIVAAVLLLPRHPPHSAF